jgi:Holliday junction DNA helicase RuvA
MISRITGRLDAIENSKAQVALESGLTYEVLLPAATALRLQNQVGQPITLQTLEFLEGSSQGSNFIPRLAGFATATDKAFFELFTTCKGIGARKALRALTLPCDQIAAAIADRDAKLLQSLPEIGKRMAETIIATLHGKVDPFISEAAYPSRGGDEPGGKDQPAAPRSSAAREALEVLLQLGEPRAAALQWIEEARRKDPDLDDAQQLIAAALAEKSRM